MFFELDQITLIIIAAIVGVFTLVMVLRLPTGFRSSFGPVIYLIPVVTAGFTLIFFEWLFVIIILFSFPFVFTALVMMAIFILRFVRKMNNWLHRREFGILQEQFRSRVRASPNPEIRFLGGQVIKAPPLIDFQNAPLIQNRQEGRMTWHPIPVVQLGPDAPLTKDWVSTKIVMPATVRQGKVLAIRIDITNNHATKDIVDQGLLEIRHPTSVAQALGPDAIKIQPNGDTVSLYYTWNVPYIPGNYVVKYHLLNLQARTEKAVVVK